MSSQIYLKVINDAVGFETFYYSCILKLTCSGHVMNKQKRLQYLQACACRELPRMKQCNEINTQTDRAWSMQIYTFCKSLCFLHRENEETTEATFNVDSGC